MMRPPFRLLRWALLCAACLALTPGSALGADGPPGTSWLQGDFRLTSPGPKDFKGYAIRFTPSCTTGACDVTGASKYGVEDSPGHQVPKLVRFPLRRTSGSSWRGGFSQLISCGRTARAMRVEFRWIFHASHSELIGGRLTATRIKGTLLYVFTKGPVASSCHGGTDPSPFTGVRK